MHEDTIKIYEGLEDQKIIKTKSFKNDSPAFTVTYPDYFIELRPNPMMQALFFASFADRNLEISISKITPNTRLEDVSKRIFSIPVHPQLENSDIEKILEALEKVSSFYIKK